MATTRISMLSNYIHYLSGRLLKVGGTSDSDVVTYIANNFYKDNSYHSMEIGTNAYVLAEGNYFVNTTKPLYDGDDPDVPGMVDVSQLESSQDDCMAQLGRLCEANVLEDSGPFASRNGTTALAAIKPHPTIARHKPQQAQQLKLLTGNFGVGELE